jgi:DUF1009 family protein
VERALGLMCGAGLLPALMAAEARRQGWRVVAFAFPGAPDLGAHAARTVPSRLSEMGPIIGALQAELVSAVALSGKFWIGDLLRAEAPDAAHARMARSAGALVDANIAGIIDSTLAGLGIELLDQRAFLGGALASEGCWSARAPSEAEQADIRRGFEVARLIASASIGQTVVLKRGAISAVEASEGTTEAIRRGTALAGPGAVVVKAVASSHDFRFDTPVIGLETLQAAAAGHAGAVAIEAGRVLVLDREAIVRRADEAGIALVSGRDPVG